MTNPRSPRPAQPAQPAESARPAPRRRELPGERHLRAAIPEIRRIATSEPQLSSAAARRIGHLLEATGGSELAVADLLTAVEQVPGVIDPAASKLRDRAHRRFGRRAATEIAPHIHQYSDRELVDEVYLLWDAVCAELFVETAIWIATTEPVRDTDTFVVVGQNHKTVSRSAARRANDRIDAMVRRLAQHALAASTGPTGWEPETPEATMLRLFPTATGTRVAGGFELGTLDPAPPAMALRFAPTVRVRRWLSLLLDVPQLELLPNARQVYDRYSSVGSSSLTILGSPETSTRATTPFMELAAEDAIDAARTIMVRKILVDTGNPKHGCALEALAAGKSFLGWARALASDVCLTKHRDALKRRQKAIATDLTMQPADGDTPFTPVQVAAARAWEQDAARAQAAEVDTVDAFADAGWDDDAEADVERRVDAGVSGDEKRLFMSAQVRTRLGLPHCTVPTSRAERDRLRALLIEDPLLAWKSLQAHHSVCSGGGMTRDQRWIDPVAIDLWLAYSADDADVLLGSGDGVIRSIAIAACLPVRVSADAERYLLEALLQLCGHPDWPGVAATLASAVGAHSRKVNAATRTALASAVHAAAAIPGSPVHDDPTVDRYLFRDLAVDALAALRLSRPSVARVSAPTE